MPSAATIILNHICPIVGVFFTNYQCLAPLKDLDTAVQKAQGLNGLNPTPWAFMLGNCLGWTAYALLSNDYYLFLADAPGFLVACWLNLGAIKLLYSAHHQTETRKALVGFLQKNDMKMEEEKKSIMIRASQEDDNNEPTKTKPVLEEHEDSAGDETLQKQETKKTVVWNSDQFDSNESKRPSLDDVDEGFEKTDEKSMFGKFSVKSTKNLMQTRMAKMKSMKQVATSFAKRAEKINEWGEVVWNVTSQQQPAKTAHEKLLMGMIGLWAVTLSVLGFFSHHDSSEDRSKLPLLVIGYIVMGNQLFFYGAPLSRIRTVIKTKKCDCIHFQSTLANSLNCGLWVAYGVAPQIADPFIWAPCAIGLIFAFIQFFLCAVYPRSKQSQEEQKRFSITGMLLPQTALGIRASLFGGSENRTSFFGISSETMDKLAEIDEKEEGEGDNFDLEKNSSKDAVDPNDPELLYMTASGRCSYLF